jgi:cold shock CspA family protein
MMGRIKMLNLGNAGGVIKTENGDSIGFEISAVLAYDVACLAVGRLVSFDLEGRHGASAVNVCVLGLHPPASDMQRRSASLRYVGFEQAQGIRSYKFERNRAGEDTEALIVTTDLALFTRHRVPIQEGPALCMRLLEAEVETGPPLRRSLTEKDLIAFLASRLVPMRASNRRVIRRSPLRPEAVSSHAGS